MLPPPTRRRADEWPFSGPSQACWVSSTYSYVLCNCFGYCVGVNRPRILSDQPYQTWGSGPVRRSEKAGGDLPAIGRPLLVTANSQPQTAENRGRETGEELGRRYAQTACKLQHYRETWDLVSSFHLTDVSCCHSGFLGKVLLGPPVLISQPPYGSA